MTMIGQDRPGLVEAVAALVAEHSGNWLESRMSRLGGHFAGILRVEVPEDRVKELIASLEGLGARGLAVVVHPDQTSKVPAPAKLSRIEIVGHDRPGIVRQISRTLASYGINVEELQTELASAAMTGETLFKASAKLAIPPTCKTDEVRQDLERIAADLIVDITLEELPISQG
jgi:glycine cleavage system regulatory protein